MLDHTSWARMTNCDPGSDILEAAGSTASCSFTLDVSIFDQIVMVLNVVAKVMGCVWTVVSPIIFQRGGVT